MQLVACGPLPGSVQAGSSPQRGTPSWVHGLAGVARVAGRHRHADCHTPWSPSLLTWRAMRFGNE